MTLECQILLAVVLDLLIGDPRRFPHPVRLIGGLAAVLEAPMRSVISDARGAGIVTAAVVVTATGLGTYVVLRVAGAVHPWLGDLVSILILWMGLASRDLIEHSTNVWRSLVADRVDDAAQGVSMICGRDTAGLDATDLTRATVESVAENVVDGVTAPIFFALLAGPIGMMMYKAINTLDSMFGYKNERYAEFGWASARLDDVAGFIPARITAFFVPVAAFLLRLRAAMSFSMLMRDRLLHSSPNAGHTEAAFAGALGVQLGGSSCYGGLPSEKPLLGDAVVPLTPAHIPVANILAFATAVLVLSVLVFLKLLVCPG